MRVLYLYSMKDDPDRVGTIAPEHTLVLRELGLPGYLGGPFGDRSGGLITFEADSLEQAEGIIAADPFAWEEMLESSWCNSGCRSSRSDRLHGIDPEGASRPSGRGDAGCCPVDGATSVNPCGGTEAT